MMRPTILCLAALIAGPATAQGSGSEAWSFAASIYGWLPGMEASIGTPHGTIDSSLDGGDALSNLDMAFMGTAEARYGKWGFIGDLIYVDLGSSQDTPFGLAFGDADVQTKVTAFSGYAVYRVYDAPQVAIDLGAGFRWFGLDTETKLGGGQLPGERFDASADWVDPLLAGRITVDFNDRWFGTAVADAGGFVTEDSSTWQALATIGYRFNDTWSAQLGYRYMNVEKEVDGRDVGLDFYGPLVGVAARF